MNRKGFYILSVLLLIAGVVNFYCRKHFKFGYSRMLSYDQLYFSEEQLRIAGIVWEKDDSLEIRFSGSPVKEQNDFMVFTDSNNAIKQRSSVLKFKLLPSLRNYRIVINSYPDTVSLDIDYTPASVFETNRNSGKPLVEITPYNINIGTSHLQSMASWNWNADSDDKTDNKLVESYVRDSIKISDTDSSEIKVRKIAAYVLEITKGKYGMPSDSMQGLDAIQQLNAARTGSSTLWCGNYANLFSFFAKKSGLVSRLIETGYEENGVINAPHVFNEVYLKEYKLWAYVDFTDGNVFVKKNNKFLNAIDIYRLQRYDAKDNEMVTSYYQDGTFVDTPFFRTSFFGQRALNHNNMVRFYYGNYTKITTHNNLWERVMHFFYTRPYYAIYSDNISLTDNQFGLRLMSTYLLLLVSLAWLFSGIRFMLSSGKNKISGYPARASQLQN